MLNSHDESGENSDLWLLDQSHFVTVQLKLLNMAKLHGSIFNVFFFLVFFFFSNSSFLFIKKDQSVIVSTSISSKFELHQAKFMKDIWWLKDGM